MQPAVFLTALKCSSYSISDVHLGKYHETLMMSSHCASIFDLKVCTVLKKEYRKWQQRWLNTGMAPNAALSPVRPEQVRVVSVGFNGPTPIVSRQPSVYGAPGTELWQLRPVEHQLP